MAPPMMKEKLDEALGTGQPYEDTTSTGNNSAVLKFPHKPGYAPFRKAHRFRAGTVALRETSRVKMLVTNEDFKDYKDSKTTVKINESKIPPKPAPEENKHTKIPLRKARRIRPGTVTLRDTSRVELLVTREDSEDYKPIAPK